MILLYNNVIQTFTKEGIKHEKENKQEIITSFILNGTLLYSYENTCGSTNHAGGTTTDNAFF